MTTFKFGPIDGMALELVSRGRRDVHRVVREMDQVGTLVGFLNQGLGRKRFTGYADLADMAENLEKRTERVRYYSEMVEDTIKSAQVFIRTTLTNCHPEAEMRGFLELIEAAKILDEKMITGIVEEFLKEYMEENRTKKSA